MNANAELIARRNRLLGSKARLFYDDPVHLVRGDGVWLFDADGNRYLDAYNNVAHVGHCHPAVVEALHRQASLLNTHTRYLHTQILDYIERLTGTMDESLSTAILTCSGSEANDVALRMAQAATGKMGIIATDATYHGNTAAVSQLSERMPPVGKRAPYVRLVKAPDVYRDDMETCPEQFGHAVGQAVASLDEEGFGVCALMIDPILANEGALNLPAGFFSSAIGHIRKAGGMIIADEVQPGFGRTGSHFWGHQRAGFLPDIVTMGKPMGNGHPLAGVITTQAIMAEFREAFTYFNTFGGNPVSCAVGNAVLDVLEEENLLANAAKTGEATEAKLSRVAEQYGFAGDVRGAGLFMGIEIVADATSHKPAPSTAALLTNAMRQQGVLIGKAGIHDNVLKIRPPMPFNMENAELLATTMKKVFDQVASEIER